MTDHRMLALVASFPVLARFVPTDPAIFSLAEFNAWIAAGPPPGSGKTHAIAFIRHLWNGSSTFSLRDAWGHWDEHQRRAWLAWAIGTTDPSVSVAIGAKGPWFP